MDSITLGTAIAISQILSTMIVAIALLISSRQAQHARRQVEASQRAQITQGTMEVVKLLTTPEMRNAAIILRTMDEVPYEQWSQEQMAAISLRCNNFDVSGMFVRSKMADEDLISNG